MRSVFERIREDFETHERDAWRQGFWALVVYRFGVWRYGVRSRWVRKPLSFVYRISRLAVQVLTGIDLPCEARIGRRLRIDHFGSLIVSGDTVIGDDCVLRHGVTLGLRHTGVRGAPRLGDRVDVGAGAKILGPVRIGDDVAIGANAVVLCDVPDRSIAVGVPAAVKPRKERS
ncbi:serine O-acetyltransferase [Myxococcaceae bacterium]|nr:serine O-acetyltransferase [Myxococcaceae bacterium]